MTAITICLGGKANFTQRASSIKTLLKNDCTSGHVTLSLRNAGVDAFKPEEYGKSIIITRKITSDSSSYKICAANGRVVSTLKDEIDQIKDHFNISIDNPLTVLTQDTARSFLANSTPKDLYNVVLFNLVLYERNSSR